VSDEALRAGLEATPEECEAGRAGLIIVEYCFPILIGAGKTTPLVRAKFDLLAGGNYPYSAPAATCLGAPLPWSPHVHPTSGTVCLGDGWAHARGRMLAAQLVVHVMRLLNCDEPDRGSDYGGWNPPAAHYWRAVLGRRPLNPDLLYPVLPADVTHAVDDENSGFRVASAGATSNDSLLGVPAGIFEPISLDAIFLPASDPDGGGFQPFRGDR
jgi:hypothetical protein